MDELNSFGEFDEAILQKLNIEGCAAGKTSYGATGPEEVRKMIDAAKTDLHH